MERAERLRRRAEVDENRGDLSAARARLAEARALVHGRADEAARAVSITVRRDEAWLWYRDGQYDTAVARLTELLDEVPPAAHALMGLVRNALGVVNYGRGDYETAALHYRRALVAKDATGDEAGAASACNNLGILAQKQGDVRAAVGWYERALRTYVKRGDRAGLARAYNNLGALYGEVGDYGKAAKYLEESIRIRHRAGHGGVALGYANLGEVRLKEGRLEEARAHLEKAIALCREGRGPGYLLPDAWRMLAELHVQLDDATAAGEAALEALTLARDCGDRPREGVALRVLGEACDQAGELETAGDWIDQAIDVLEELEQPLELGRAYAARARHLERLGDAGATTAQAQADALLAAVRST